MVIGQAETAEDVEVSVWRALSAVPDPEIPPCSITDLGIVERVTVSDSTIQVDLVPTFAGCPALDVIREDAAEAVRAVAADRSVLVRFVYSTPWTSDRITPAGREALRQHGITPPVRGARVVIPLAGLLRAEGGTVCPFCGSEETVLESAFGPTLCRSTHFCSSCRNPFEAFKPKVAAPNR